MRKGECGLRQGVVAARHTRFHDIYVDNNTGDVLLAC